MDLWRALSYAMRGWQIGPDDADRLVAGGPPGPGERGVGALLAAAAAPPDAAELAAEPAAVAAFHEAQSRVAPLRLAGSRPRSAGSPPRS